MYWFLFPDLAQKCCTLAELKSTCGAEEGYVLFETSLRSTLLRICLKLNASRCQYSLERLVPSSPLFSIVCQLSSLGCNPRH